ncbi:MAG: (Fe-S)-binding protein [Theionarchaea archaeon]|nr:(Fe-S)-binding protein [Theionarchaea archaeon]MBU7001140.1 (Fe-S)-binding protein [Theionarchaea archaeon]MBU7019919.1 (Fe-S)-binding protein [Theionarchaea archaeon]MBU7035382.1 (Fe-S)-binding protein [Theionarchaea archaeon]MBU7039546.1 (Fe-S)-binding protein [Theionarchaea archaeon]
MLEEFKKYLWVAKAISRLTLSTQKEVVIRFLTAKKKYLPEDNPKAQVEDILKCALCPNMCRFDCPVLQAAKSETYSPAGRARIAYLLEMGRVSSHDAVELMYACAACSACQQWCPFDFSVDDLLMGVRRDLVDRNLVPETLMDIKDQIVRTRTIYQNSRTSLGLEPRKADILYVAGCTVLNKERIIAQTAMKILEKAGITVTTLPEEWCCGAPLNLLGFEDDFKKFAAHNADSIKKSGCKKMICSCPECVYTFKEVYAKEGHPLQVEVMHTSEYFLELIEQGKIQFKELQRDLVYHDPCVLARKLHITEQPRKVLEAIPGVSVKEPPLTKEHTRCCGIGGLLAITNPELSVTLLRARDSELCKLADTVVTACPACKIAFKRTRNAESRDLSEIVLEGMN